MIMFLAKKKSQNHKIIKLPVLSTVEYSTLNRKSGVKVKSDVSSFREKH